MQTNNDFGVNIMCTVQRVQWDEGGNDMRHNRLGGGESGGEWVRSAMSPFQEIFCRRRPQHLQGGRRTLCRKRTKRVARPNRAAPSAIRPTPCPRIAPHTAGRAAAPGQDEEGDVREGPFGISGFRAATIRKRVTFVLPPSPPPPEVA